MFKPEGFSNDIFKARYAFTEDETWENCCKRVARQMAIAEAPDKVQKYQDAFNELLINNYFAPGGRIWYNSGRPNPQLLNCFSGDTKFITKTGILQFDTCVGQSVDVFNMDGEWEKATVCKFGKQEIVNLTLSNGDVIKTTKGHLWIQEDGSRVSTMNLNKVLMSRVGPSDMDDEGIRHGIIYGDGSLYCKNQYTAVAFFTEEKEKLHRFFPEKIDISVGHGGAVRKYSNKTSWMINEKPRVVIKRQSNTYKSLPDKLTPNYARGFIAGLMATDGCVPKKGSYIITCEGIEKAKRIAEIAVLGGCVVTSIKVGSNKNPYNNSKREHCRILMKPFSVPLIREDQIVRKNNTNIRENYHMYMNVSNIVCTGLYEDVYCVVAPKTHSFTLANGILTGNCFVLGNQIDSREGWGNLSRESIITSMTGGGCGSEYSDVRPKGAEIKGQRGTAPGAVELMRLINGNGKAVRAGGSRRVANMFSLDLTHPDIEEFLNAKLENGELELANISVRCKDTTSFIDLIKNDGDLELSWKNKYKRLVSARKIWDIIVRNAYNSAEPGFLNWELVLNENTIYYLTELVTTNPCGEITLEAYGSCCLGHLVLPRFITSAGNVNWELMGKTIRTAVRFLDNVLDINNYPLPEMKETAHKHRRIGLGSTGLADMLIMLGYKYGSEEGNKFIDKLERFISKQAYEASIMLAVEKGPFPVCDYEKHTKSGFIKRMTPKIRSLIEEHGIRNCAILTKAPVGTVSILSGNCSSGIEPIMAPAYERRYFNGEERKIELVFHPLFVEFMEQGKDVSHFVGGTEVPVEAHLEVQRIIQRHVDNSVSKTINIPEDYPMEKMSELWLEYLPSLKGVTFYRQNSRKFIDKDGVEHLPPISPLSLEASIKLYNETKDIKVGGEVQQCKGGVCEL